MRNKKLAVELIKLARELVAEEVVDDMMGKVADFLHENPKPSDDDFHEWAEKAGVDKHEAEAAAYRLATLFVEFWKDGLANKEGFKEEDADPEELKMGIEIEYEHTPNPKVSKRIALDHLAEISDYYTRLKKMEEEAGVE